LNHENCSDTDTKAEEYYKMKSKGIHHSIKNLKAEIKRNKAVGILYVFLRILVILTLTASIISGNIEAAALCVLSLVLFLIPAFLEKQLKIVIPELLHGIVLLFIFAAEILGDVNHFYIRIPFWDTMLHTLNGFLCAAVGLSLVNLLNENSEHTNLSPLYLTLAAFCFSMTIGVIWEFFECALDLLFHLDMQNDFVVSTFSSVSLDPTGAGTRICVSGITRTIIETVSGANYVIEGGYLDIGILDTMKDLFVNFIGAFIYSLISFYSLKHGKGKPFNNSLVLKTIDVS